MPSSRRPKSFTVAATVALFGTALVAPGSAFGIVAQHTTLGSFQASIRTNVVVETFTGPDSASVPSYAISGGGFSATLDVSNPGLDLFRYQGRMGSAFAAESTQLTFTGRPVSAFAADLVVLNAGLTSVAGSVILTTDTGETMMVAVAAGGTFFGFTTSRPFSTLSINATAIGAFEFMDTAQFGIAANAPELTDQCADAEIVISASPTQYAFSTAGATTTLIQGVCDGTTDTGPDVWVRFVSPLNGNVTVSTCGCTFDSILRVFETCPNAFGDGQVACNDDFCASTSGFTASSAQFHAAAGEDYLVRVSGFSGASGSGNLTFSITPDCSADADHSGGVSVNDLFKFLADWFAQNGVCP